MLARITEMHIRPDKLETFRNILTNDVLPALKEQHGFVDTLGLVSQTSSNIGISVTLWKTKEDLETYERELYPKLIEKITPMLTQPPRIDVFRVEASTFHRISAGMAA